MYREINTCALVKALEKKKLAHVLNKTDTNISAKRSPTGCGIK